MSGESAFSYVVGDDGIVVSGTMGGVTWGPVLLEDLEIALELSDDPTRVFLGYARWSMPAVKGAPK